MTRVKTECQAGITDAWGQMSVQAQTGLLHKYFFFCINIFSKKKQQKNAFCYTWNLKVTDDVDFIEKKTFFKTLSRSF